MASPTSQATFEALRLPAGFRGRLARWRSRVRPTLLVFTALGTLPALVLFGIRWVSHPYAFPGVTEGGLTAWLQLPIAWVLSMGLCGSAVLVWVRPLERRRPARALFITLVAYGALGLGLLLGGQLYGLAKPALLRHFVARTAPMVAALDAHVAEHGEPPAELAAVPFGLGRLELRRDESGRWAFELPLGVYAVGKLDRLALRPADARGTRPDGKCIGWETYGPWDRYLGF